MRYESKFGIAITVTVVVMVLLIVGIEMHQPDTTKQHKISFSSGITNDQTFMDGLVDDILREFANEKRAEEYANTIREKCVSSGNVYTFEGNVHTCSSGDENESG